MRPSRAVTSASCRYASGGTGSFATAWRSARSAAGRSPASRPGAAQLRERVAGGIRSARRLLQRFDRLVERDAIAAALRFGQPHVAERRIDLRRVREALDRAAERDHGGVLAAGARLREADRHDAIGARRLERGQRLELVDGPAVVAVEQIHLRQRLARRRLAGRRAARRFFERLARRRQLIEIALHEAEHVMRFAHRGIDARAPAAGPASPAFGAAGAIARESKLVEDPRVAIVEAR